MFKKIYSKLLSFILTFLLMITLAVPSVIVKADDSAISVKVRIESNDHTIIPETQVNISNFDITPYNCKNVSGDPKAIHAIIKALEANGLNPKDQSKYDFGGGSYITDIEGVKSSDAGKSAGWMYFVNNQAGDVAINDKVLKNNDSLVLFLTEDYNNSQYGYFDNENVNAKVQDKVQLKLNELPLWGPGGNAVAGANIIINNQSTNYVTDENGNISLNFDKAGTYTITADKKDTKTGTRLISRPFCKVTVSENTPTPTPIPTPGGSGNTPVSNVTSYDLKQEENNTLNYIKANNLDEWSALSLSKFGVSGQKDYFNQTVKQFKDGVKEDGLSGYFYKDTDLEKMIIYVTSQGYNPYNFLGYDLVKELYNRNINEFNRFAQIFGVITYDYANVKDGYKITKRELVDKLLNAKIVSTAQDGKTYTGWSFDDSSKDIDIDTTGAVISALSDYYGTDSEVKNAVDAAVNTLSMLQKNDGSFETWGSETSETTSYVILGLTSVGIDPNGALFTKDNGGVKNNLTSAVMSFKSSDGQYKHTRDAEGSYYSTEEAFRALIALNEFQSKGKYNYYASNIDASALPVYIENSSTSAQDNNASTGTNSNTNAAASDDSKASSDKNSLTALPQTGFALDGEVLIAIGIISLVAGVVLIKTRKSCSK